MPNRRGGRRAGAGRKPLGYPANTETTVPRSVRLRPDQWDRLAALGGGNATAGVRRLLDAREREALLLRYVEAYDRADWEALADVLRRAAADAGLDREVAEMNRVLWEEALGDSPDSAPKPLDAD